MLPSVIPLYRLKFPHIHHKKRGYFSCSDHKKGRVWAIKEIKKGNTNRHNFIKQKSLTGMSLTSSFNFMGMKF
jgi:hypothetical protein